MKIACLGVCVAAFLNALAVADEIDTIIQKLETDAAVPAVDPKARYEIVGERFNKSLMAIGNQELCEKLAALKRDEDRRFPILLDGAIVSRLTRNDPNAVREVLAIGCPKVLGLNNAIAKVLALSGSEYLRTLLGAYKLTSDSENKKDIIAVLRHAFPIESRKSEKDDPSFLDAVGGRITAEEKDWRVNDRYGVAFYTAGGRVEPLFESDRERMR